MEKETPILTGSLGGRIRRLSGSHISPAEDPVLPSVGGAPRCDRMSGMQRGGGQNVGAFRWPVWRIP